jgi:hypothetical protein
LTEFTQETDRFLGALPKGSMQFGDENPKQNGIEWYFKTDDTEYFAEVTHEGLFHYKESRKRDDKLYYPRMIRIMLDAVNFAIGIYKEFGFTGRVIVSLALDGTRNRSLIGEGKGVTSISPRARIAVQKEIDLDQLVLDPVAVVARMFLNIARDFKWAMSNDEATRIVNSCLH